MRKNGGEATTKRVRPPALCVHVIDRASTTKAISAEQIWGRLNRPGHGLQLPAQGCAVTYTASVAPTVGKYMYGIQVC